MSPRRYAPRACPVCSEPLAVTRLGCRACGTDLSGDFESCEFCALSVEDRQLLRVFLSSRGNMKELERHLSVSYPTARARFDALLSSLGMSGPAKETQNVLEALARGEIDPDEAYRRLR